MQSPTFDRILTRPAVVLAMAVVMLVAAMVLAFLLMAVPGREAIGLAQDVVGLATDVVAVPCPVDDHRDRGIEAGAGGDLLADRLRCGPQVGGIEGVLLRARGLGRGGEGHEGGGQAADDRVCCAGDPSRFRFDRKTQFGGELAEIGDETAALDLDHGAADIGVLPARRDDLDRASERFVERPLDVIFVLDEFTAFTADAGGPFAGWIDTLDRPQGLPPGSGSYCASASAYSADEPT